MMESLAHALTEDEYVLDPFGRGHVYFLADPRTPRHPRYIGVTNSPEQRARDHGQSGQKSNPGLWAWKQSLRSEGLKPVLVVVRVYEWRDEGLRAEAALIRRWRRRGLADLNMAGA